jgi:hypothetical protein
MDIALSIGNRVKKSKTEVIPYYALLRQFSAPAGKVFLLYGESAVFDLSLMIAAQVMSRGEHIAVVDGCNQFNVHALVRFAQRKKINPDQFLRRIFVSRGFTCYQMDAAINDRLPAFLRRINSHTAMVFGLLDTFYDEQAPLREVQQILARVSASLRAMKQKNISMLIVCKERTVEPEERNQLFNRLKKAVDGVYLLHIDEFNRPRLIVERSEMPSYGIEQGGETPPLQKLCCERAMISSIDLLGA